MRRPISRVRSVTDTSMMFMMPMPPTSSETDAIARQQHRHDLRATASWACEHLGEVADAEVVVLAGLEAVALAQQLADLRPRPPPSGAASRTLTRDRPTARRLAWFVAEHLLLGGGERDQDEVVLVLAPGGLALAARARRSTVNGTFLIRIDLAERDRASPNRFCADGLAERAATLAAPSTSSRVESAAVAISPSRAPRSSRG